MIRVNLLPSKREASSGDGTPIWYAVIGIAVVLEIVALVLVQKSMNDTLDGVNQKNREIQATIDESKRQMANHGDIKAQLKELRDREEAIGKLQSARTGPTSVLLELSKVLTAGRGPTANRDKVEQLRRDNPQAVPNPNWDTRRLWLTHYAESDRAVRMTGLARDAEDVSEFLRRLSLSDYFYELKLLPASKTIDPVTHLELVRFELSAKVRY